jgi:HAMP domain-containing protein
MGITIITFLDKEGVAFLRMQTPQSFGDATNKKITTVRKAMETGQVTAGIDLAKPGLSRGSCRPIRDKDGSILGYIIVGGSLDQFLSTMKSQTSDDYIFMGYKSFLDEKLYHAARKAKNQPDTWSQFPNTVVLATSMEVQSDPHYEQALKDLPASGRLLGQSESGGSTFVNGVFPLYDASERAIGGIFVRHDVTALHQGMKRVQNLAIVALVALVVILSLAIAMVLNRLVFVRLRRTMDVVTRVVGGDISRQIVPASADEVGHLEELFEQFRTIFVSVCDDLTEARKEEPKRSA